MKNYEKKQTKNPENTEIPQGIPDCLSEVETLAGVTGGKAEKESCMPVV